MPQYLVFRLYAPLASWGEIAVGEVRRSAFHPSKSAIIGLLSAALGIDRYDETQLKQMVEGYILGVKVLSQGILMQDYQTIDAPPENKKRNYKTRKEELSVNKDDRSTLQSWRQYLCDSLYVIAIRCHENAPYSLERLKEALKEPVFHLYLGRKSYPLAHPLEPQIVEGSLRQALDSNLPRDQLESKSLIELLTVDKSLAHYFWEPTDNSDDLQETIRTERPDVPINRRAWYFKQRKECRGVAKENK